MQVKIKILIADDSAAIRNKFCELLKKVPEFVVVGEVGRGDEAVLFCRKNEVDIVLMDIEMEYDFAGIDATGHILSECPSCRVIILTVHDQDRHIFEAYEKGVSDYITKNAPQHEIIQAICDTYRGMAPVRPLVAEKLRQEFQRVRQKEKNLIYMLAMLSRLTTSEMDILNLIASGKSKAEVCQLRYVEFSTLKSQIRSILHKFGASKMQEIIQPLNDMHIFELMHSYQQEDLAKPIKRWRNN
jgi:DNA-binding NarL/FixJ family response regulator